MHLNCSNILTATILSKSRWVKLGFKLKLLALMSFIEVCVQRNHLTIEKYKADIKYYLETLNFELTL
jgi:hypothetical protein